MKAPAAVATLPAASVEDTARVTLPSGRPAGGSEPELGTAELRSMLHLPVASVVVE